MHSRKVFHRDLKSLNVLLDTDFRAIITDFGAAVYDGNWSGIFSSARGGGTELWRAPEYQLTKDTRPTSPGDVYAFAITCVEVRIRTTI